MTKPFYGIRVDLKQKETVITRIAYSPRGTKYLSGRRVVESTVRDKVALKSDIAQAISELMLFSE